MELEKREYDDGDGGPGPGSMVGRTWCTKAGGDRMDSMNLMILLGIYQDSQDLIC